MTYLTRVAHDRWNVSLVEKIIPLKELHRESGSAAIWMGFIEKLRGIYSPGSYGIMIIYLNKKKKEKDWDKLVSRPQQTTALNWF